MKVVVDTNVAVSGLLWQGPPNEILKWSRLGILKIIACDETVNELRRVLRYKRFYRRLSVLATSSDEVYAYFMNLVLFVPKPKFIPTKIKEDPLDNLFLALASENKAHMIISGDNHLLDLQAFEDIQIVTPSEACQVVESFLYNH
jgi:uncharacterized protein